MERLADQGWESKCCKLTSRRPAGRRFGLQRLMRRRGPRLLLPRLVQLVPRAGRERGVLQPQQDRVQDTAAGILTNEPARRTAGLLVCMARSLLSQKTAGVPAGRVLCSAPGPHCNTAS